MTYAGTNYQNEYMSVLETNYNPTTISSASLTASCNTNGDLLVTVTLGSSLNSGEYLYLRYTTNSYSSSTLVDTGMTGTTGTFRIPYTSASAAVSFYFYTSPRTASAINSDVSSNGERVHDLSTLNLLNNSGNNYSFTMNNVLATGASSGTLVKGYSTLKGAFDDVNSGTIKGTNVGIYVFANTTETASAALNASGSGSASYTNVAIQPVRYATRTVSGSLSAPLVDLNGADNVTIDGINSNGTYLVLDNSSISTTAATIRFQNDATYNTVKNVKLLGSAHAGYTSNTDGCTVWFGTSASGTTGNDYNKISYCNIGPSGSNFPFIAIKSYGTTSITNDNITVEYCNIYDFRRDTANNWGGHAIIFYAASGASTFDNNRIYQTSSISYSTAGMIMTGIRVETGSGYTITNNTIGFGASDGSGTWTQSGSSNRFMGIYFGGASASKTTIAGNVISGISQTSSVATTTFGQGNHPFVGIYVASGLVDVGSSTSGNLIGKTSGTGITVTLSSTSLTIPVTGIYLTGSGTTTIQKNSIAGFSLPQTTTGMKHGFTGIYSGNTGTVSISNNNIGYGGANNISLASGYTGSGGQAIGIWIPTTAGNGTYTLNGNTIHNLTNAAANINADSGASVIGIFFAPGSGPTVNVYSNTIDSLTNSASSSGNYYVTGIYYANSTSSCSIYNNTIYDLNIANPSTTASILGIYQGGGTLPIYNNMISLGRGITSNPSISCFYQFGGTPTVVHNTFVITGTPSGTSFASACASFLNMNSGSSLKNNILHNERTNATTSVGNYAVLTNSTNFISYYSPNFNDLYTSGSYLGRINTTDYATLNDWQAVSGSPDPNSISYAVSFTDVATDLHVTAANNCNISGMGTYLSSYGTDVDGTSRNSTHPDIGADEWTPGRLYQWRGNNSRNWSADTNWCNYTVPSSNDTTWFTDQALRPVLLKSGDNASTYDLKISSGGKLSASGGTLNIYGTVTDNGTDSLNYGGTLVYRSTSAAQSIVFTNIYHLECNNSNNISLSGNTSINGNVTFTSGKINPNGFNVDLVGGTSGQNENRYFVFPGTQNSGSTVTMRVNNTNTDVLIPVGTSTYAPVTLNESSSASSFKAVVDIFDDVLNNGTTGSTISSIAHAVNKTWLVSQTGGSTFSYTMTCQWMTSQEGVNFDETRCGIGHYYSGSWDAAPTVGAATTGTVNGSLQISRTGLTSFSPFAVGDRYSPLPVTWLTFNAVAMDAQTVKLDWSTATEINNSGFFVERSRDGKSFVDAGFMPGAGNSQVVNQYGFIDKPGQSGVWYYRLRQVDADGKYNYSDIRMVTLDGTSPVVSFFPNPAADQLTITIANSGTGITSCELTDLSGRLIMKQVSEQGQTMQTVKFDVSNLPTGIYLIRYVASGKTLVEKFRKQ